MQKHEHLHPHALPVKDSNKAKFIFVSLAFSSLSAIAFGITLHFFGIPAGVIIPSAVPLWIGTLNLGYMMQVET